MSTTQHDLDAEISVGPHRYVVEGLGVVHLHLVGNLELPHARQILPLINGISAPKGVYLLRDARSAGTIAPDAREFISKNMRPGSVVATVSYGASFHTRTVLTMVARAIRAFNKSVPIVVFTATEAEARAWIEKHRAGVST
jgi:hypothetical protein